MKLGGKLPVTGQQKGLLKKTKNNNKNALSQMRAKVLARTGLNLP